MNINGDYNKIIIDKSNKNSKEYYNFCYSENNLVSKCNYKNESKNKKFYNCYKINKVCPRKALYDKINEFSVYVKCNFEINHETFKFEKFEILFNFRKKYNQKQN